MVKTNSLTNLTTAAEKATDIRDIRPPIPIPNYWVWLWLGVGLIVVAVAAFLLWRALRARRAVINTPPPIPPHVLARRALESALQWIDQPKPFVIAVSDALRTYLEQAFQLRAPERTTEEFLRELPDSAMLSTAQKDALSEFMTQCDLVKFARYEPREAELRDLHAAALELVAQTEPQQPVTPDVPRTMHQVAGNPDEPPSLPNIAATPNDASNPTAVVNRKS